MPKASEVAAEFRKLADRLEEHPDRIVPKPFCLFAAEDKESFLNIARSLPRPLQKTVEGEKGPNPTIQLIYSNDIARFYTRVYQSLACELVEPARPAKYKCHPILTGEEFAGLEA